MKRTMIAIVFAAVAAVLVSSCASEKTEMFKQQTANTAKKSYSQAKYLANEYYVTVRDDIKSFDTSEPEEIDKRFSVLAIAPEATAPAIAEIVKDSELEPDFIYTTGEATAQIAPLEIRENINELGLKRVSVYFQTAKASPFQWAFKGDAERTYNYIFVWFDEKGKLIAADKSARKYDFHPGASIRLVGYAPTEECKGYSLIILPEKEAKETAAAISGDSTVVTSSGTPDPAFSADAQPDTGKKTAEDTKKLIEANK